MSSLTGLTSSSSDLSSPEVTILVLSAASASRTNRTLHFEHPRVLLQSQSWGITNRFRSVYNGIIPSLCATASSWTTEELSIITTSSIAKVGTSLIASLLRAFTYSLGIFLNLTLILSLSFSRSSTEGEFNTLEDLIKAS